MSAGERVCVAVSGGADSVALLLALVEANRAKEALGVVLSAVHVHHGLRGADADADEAFVRELCERLERAADGGARGCRGPAERQSARDWKRRRESCGMGCSGG